MPQGERRFWKWLTDHRMHILAAAATLLSLYVRFMLRGIQTRDMQASLLPWYHDIKALGGFSALRYQIGNYNVPYQTLIAIMTYLPIDPVYGYKGISIFFDYALSIAVAMGVYTLRRSKSSAVVAYALGVNLPTVVFNSAAWGQCDAIYTFFLVACFMCLMREKHTAAFLLYGCAFAFKLQATFFLPFLLFYYVWSKRIPCWKFLLIPLPLIAFSAIALSQGRPLGSLLEAYESQMVEFPRISWNYPSFWVTLVENLAQDGRDYYFELHTYCLVLTVIALAVIMIWLLAKEKLNQTALLMAAVLMIYTCVLFLPVMHDRYIYSVVLLGFMACFIWPRMIPAEVGLLLIDVQLYGSGIFDTQILPWEALSLCNIACYGGVVYAAIRAVQGSAQTEPAKDMAMAGRESHA